MKLLGSNFMPSSVLTNLSCPGRFRILTLWCQNLLNTCGQLEKGDQRRMTRLLVCKTKIPKFEAAFHQVGDSWKYGAQPKSQTGLRPSQRECFWLWQATLCWMTNVNSVWGFWFGFILCSEQANFWGCLQFSMNAPSQVAVISLGLTKGGKRQGALESATLGVEGVLKLLWKWKRRCKPNSPLCPAPHKWRAMLSGTLTALKLDSFGFRPYSLRRGGATHWFRHHGSLDKLMVQGQWAAQKTAKVYINEGSGYLGWDECANLKAEAICRNLP